MADIAVTAQLSFDRRATIARRISFGDKRFKLLTQLSALFVIFIFAGVFYALAVGGYPAFKTFGWKFFYSQAWNPVTEHFGALASIYGTVVTAFGAMLLAVPIGIGIAFFLTELCPRPLRRPIGIAIELLAGIPSIIYGIWGLFVFAPWFQQHVQPWMIGAFANIPILQNLFAGP